MKISFAKPVYYNTQCVSKPKTFSADYSGRHENVAFYGYKDLVTKSVKLGSEIKSSDEYAKILEEVYGFRNKEGKLLFKSELNKRLYPKVKKEQEGILLYAGTGDLSDEINRYLSGRPMRYMDEKQVKSVIQVLDYSLNSLDKECGKYSGIVYRQGYFPIERKQFISTTTDPIIAATLRGGICFDKNLDFSIIKTKNGHKIKDFQKKIGSEYAEEEKEILLSRKNKYREILNPQGGFLMLKNKFHKILEAYAHEQLNPARIRVFEEI